jgi:hypothetical protein
MSAGDGDMGRLLKQGARHDEILPSPAFFNGGHPFVFKSKFGVIGGARMGYDNFRMKGEGAPKPRRNKIKK